MGNPSDGYFGKTVSLIVKDFYAEAILYEWEDVELVLSQEDHSRFRTIADLYRDVELHGYYGGIRLVKATIKKFIEYCRSEQLSLHDRKFSIRYESNIPRAVGLAGSSGIIVATLRALMKFYGVSIPIHVQPSLVLSVENDELGIAGGLQDRVIQVYEGLVYMNFARESMVHAHGYLCGQYEALDPALLPPIYIAYSTEAGNPTEVQHVPLRARWNQGDPQVIDAMKQFADLAEQAKDAIQDQDAERLAALINANFDLRRALVPLPSNQLEMVETARAAVATAKFAGSGGAIVGTYRDDAMYRELVARLAAINCRVLRPIY